MRVPLYNEYPLPAQQADAAARHPMLAPRPIDASTAGYQPYPTTQSVPLEENETTNAPHFYYPTPPVHAVPWPTQTSQHGIEGRHPLTTSLFGVQSGAGTSDQDGVQFLTETTNQWMQTNTHWAKPPAYSFAPGPVTPKSDETTEGYIPQVSVDLKRSRIGMTAVLSRFVGPLL